MASPSTDPARAADWLLLGMQFACRCSCCSTIVPSPPAQQRRYWRSTACFNATRYGLYAATPMHAGAGAGAGAAHLLLWPVSQQSIHLARICGAHIQASRAGDEGAPVEAGVSNSGRVHQGQHVADVSLQGTGDRLQQQGVHLSAACREASWLPSLACPHLAPTPLLRRRLQLCYASMPRLPGAPHSWRRASPCAGV